jgi:hypothetical protein
MPITAVLSPPGTSLTVLFTSYNVFIVLHSIHIMEIQSKKVYIRNLFSFQIIHVYDEVRNFYKLTVLQFSSPLLCTFLQQSQVC